MQVAEQAVIQRRYEGVWQGREALLHLDKAGLSPAAVDSLWESYLAARKSDEEAEPGDFKIGGIALGTICRCVAHGLRPWERGVWESVCASPLLRRRMTVTLRAR